MSEESVVEDLIKLWFCLGGRKIENDTWFSITDLLRKLLFLITMVINLQGPFKEKKEFLTSIVQLPKIITLVLRRKKCYLLLNDQWFHCLHKFILGEIKLLLPFQNSRAGALLLIQLQIVVGI